MLAGRAMYIWDLKVSLAGGSVADMVAKAQRARISSLWPKIGDGQAAYLNIGPMAQQLRDLVAQCSAVNIAVLGYHVPHCESDQAARAEVDFLDRTVHDFNLAGVVVDNEDGPSYFKGNAQTARTYGTGLHAAMSAKGKLVVMSSNDIISAHTDAFATTIGASIDLNAPQVYYGQSRSVDSRLNWAIDENKSIPAPFFPTGAAFLRKPTENDGGFLNPLKCAAWATRFIKLVSDLHRSDPAKYPGYSFWNWQEAPSQVWDVLNATDVFVDTAAAPAMAEASAAAPARSLAEVIGGIDRPDDSLPFIGRTAADLDLPGNTLVITSGDMFYSFRTADIVDREPLSGDTWCVWVRKGSRAWQSTAIAVGGVFAQRETMVGMEDLPAPPSEDVPGMPVQATEQHRQALAPAAAAGAAPTIAAVAAAYNAKCIGGDHYQNNCAHYLSDAFIRAGYDELAAGHSADPFITARCGTPAKRAIRARDMWKWFQSKATETASSLDKDTGIWAVFQLDESVYWGGHVVIVDTDNWTWYGTGFHPTWHQYCYRW
jgi:hypothetical protein